MNGTKYYLTLRQEGADIGYTIQNPIGNVLVKNEDLELLANGCLNAGIELKAKTDIGTIKRDISRGKYKDKKIDSSKIFDEFWKSYTAYKKWLNYRRKGEPLPDSLGAGGDGQARIKPVNLNEKPLR